MVKKIEDDRVTVVLTAAGSELRCPRCGGANLHQSDVVVFNRLEDEARLWQTTISDFRVETKSTVAAVSGNPSPRRHGLVVEFWCEECGSGATEQDPIQLSIFQHKGATFLQWRYTRKEPSKINKID